MNNKARSSRGISVGLTGGIACGKSEVGHLLEASGVSVRDADIIAHGLMEPGQPAYDRVVAYFGSGILSPDGRIDRERLGDRVFSHAADREQLNGIVHPLVLDALTGWIRGNTERGIDTLSIVPLLYEAGAEELFDVIVCVTAPEEKIVDRLRSRGLSKEQAQQRITSQLPLAEKISRADEVINNNGSIEDLKETTMKIWNSIENKERARHG